MCAIVQRLSVWIFIGLGNMKKKIRTCIIIIILLILFFPIPKGTLDDGGSKKTWTEEMQKAQEKKANMIAQQISMLNMQLVQLQKTKSQSTV